MNLSEHVNNILGLTDFSANCHGLQAVESATAVARYYFEKENISFEGWKVSEIPMTDDSGEYPVAVAICLENPSEYLAFTLDLTRSGELFDCCPDDCCEISVGTIREAIHHPRASYGQPEDVEFIRQTARKFDLAVMG